MTAFAGLIGLEYSACTLLFGHVQSRRAALEQAFLQRRPDEGELFFAAEYGIDAVERLASHRKLHRDMIRNYTFPLLQDRLDLLPGSDKPDKAFFAAMKDSLQTILETAEWYYDLILIDGGSGLRSEWTQRLLQQAELVVVSLNQNGRVQERFFREQISHLPAAKRLLVLGQYDRFSHLTAKNIARLFQLHEPIYTVPHNAGWMDAMQEGQALDFLFRNRQAPRDHENHFFMQELRKLAQAVMMQVGLNKLFFGGREG
nr:hypothetical protein [Cohnella zeiphila]